MKNSSHMKHLIDRAYAAQRLVSWKKLTARMRSEFVDDLIAAILIFLALAILALTAI